VCISPFKRKNNDKNKPMTYLYKKYTSSSVGVQKFNDIKNTQVGGKVNLKILSLSLSLALVFHKGREALIKTILASE
jgi:hypothetical protein